MKSELADAPTGPLRGVRVIDHTSVIFGPFGAQTLGDLGADVVKIEPSGPNGARDGDPTRGNGPRVPGTDDLTPLFIGVNRNKRAVALNLREPDERKTLIELIRTADVFVSNSRLAGLKKLGLTYEDVISIKPDIIYVHATGFGSSGPYAGRAAYDDVIQAAAGVSYLLTHKNEDAAPRFIPGSIADKVSGMFLTQAVTAALYNRAIHGEGQFVEVPMFECMVAFNMIEHIHGHAVSPAIADTGYPRVFEPWSRPLRTADGYIATLVYNMEQWKRLIGVVGIDPAIFDDASYFGPSGPNRDRLVPLLEDTMKHLTTSEWEAKLHEADVAYSRQNSFVDVLNDPHLTDVGLFEEIDHASAGTVRMIRHPVLYAKTPANIRRHAPGFAEHNDELKGELRAREQRDAEA